MVVCGSVWAQDAPAAHSLRILPLGDPPPFVQEVRDGVRHEVPPPEGTVPPRNVILSGTPPEGAGKEELPLRLRLGTPSAPVSFPSPPDGAMSAVTETGQHWLRIPLSEAPASIALVWRDGKTWSTARALTVADSGKQGDFRMVNVTGRPMAITWGKEKIRLNPAVSIVKRIPDGLAKLALTIEYPTPEGGLKPCFASEVELVPQTRHLFVIYAADGEKQRQPVKVREVVDHLE